MEEVALTRPDVHLTQEMRFAVVMYGGTSLAIYINGVVQELLALVRATAPETLSSGEKIALIPTEELRDVFDKRRRELAAEPRLEPRPPPSPGWKQFLASRAAWVGAVVVVAVVVLAVVEVVVHLGSDLRHLVGL